MIYENVKNAEQKKKKTKMNAQIDRQIKKEEEEEKEIKKKKGSFEFRVMVSRVTRIQGCLMS